MWKVVSEKTSAIRGGLMVCALAAATMLSGCASHYVDRSTRDVAPSEMKQVEPKVPVQLMFEFQTKGVLNTQGTAGLKDDVLKHVRASQLFSAVETTPVTGGRMLNVVINNVPLTDDAFAKGFATGLTFGLAGSQVSDGYVCTVKYMNGLEAKPVVAASRHAIHTVVGAGSAPANADKAESIEAAVRTMTRQIVGTALKDLSNQEAFK